MPLASWVSDGVAERRQGAVAVVTGAANGIGQAFAVRLARQGARVALVDVVDTGETAAQIAGFGGRALELGCDVADEGSVQMAASAVSSELGVAVVVANVAAIGSPAARFPDVAFEDWRRVHAVNLDGPFFVCRAFAAGMRKAGTGRIVNVSAGMIATTTTGCAPYISSKLALVGLTRALANDLGDAGITVNAVAPGLVRNRSTLALWKDTPEFFDVIAQAQVIKRTIECEDVVDAMDFLTSAEAGMITGQTILVEGGMLRL
jgi:NAD(P)-dependent dehydrogenase (short-subunit alcohol dehydrogenase family)